MHTHKHTQKALIFYFNFLFVLEVFWNTFYKKNNLIYTKHKAHGVNLCCKCVIWRTNFDTC